MITDIVLFDESIDGTETENERSTNPLLLTQLRFPRQKATRSERAPVSLKSSETLASSTVALYFFVSSSRGIAQRRIISILSFSLSTTRGLHLLFSSRPSLPFSVLSSILVCCRSPLPPTSSDTLTPVSATLSPFLLRLPRQTELKARGEGTGRAERKRPRRPRSQPLILSLSFCRPRRILAAPRNKDPTTSERPKHCVAATRACACVG